MGAGRRKFRPRPPFSLFWTRAAWLQIVSMMECWRAQLRCYFPPLPDRVCSDRRTSSGANTVVTGQARGSRHVVGAGEGGTTDSARGAARGRATGCSLEARVRSGEMGACAGRVKRGGGRGTCSDRGVGGSGVCHILGALGGGGGVTVCARGTTENGGRRGAHVAVRLPARALEKAIASRKEGCQLRCTSLGPWPLHVTRLRWNSTLRGARQDPGRAPFPRAVLSTRTGVMCAAAL